MTLADLAIHLESLSVNHLKILVGHNVYIATLGQTNTTCSHTVSASDPALEHAVGQALALWERVNTPPTKG